MAAEGHGTIRVICVDDHPLFRSGVRTLLSTTDDIVLVGEAETAGEAAERVAATGADVVLMDLQLPDGDGIAATCAVLARSPDTAVLVLTMRGDDRAVTAALQAGARGYLLKSSPPEDLLRAIYAVGAGQAVLGRGVAPARLAAAPGGGDMPFARLTPREREVVERLAAGRSNQDIAAELNLSTKSVANTVSIVLGKLHARDRAHAVALARDAGLGGTASEHGAPRRGG